MKFQTVREPSTLIPLVVLGWSAMFMPTHCAGAGPMDPPATSGSAPRDGDRSGRIGQSTPQFGLDNTPRGGTLPGGTVPGGTVPGGRLPGGTLPGGTVPGGTLQDGTVPGGTVPSATVPSEKLPGEDG
jgi:hypothetical protein